MLTLKSWRSRGDTLIEVLFATAIFSLIAVGGLAIMNQGLAASQRALEITLVRNEVDAQAEALRFLNASYIAAYQPNSSYDANTPAGQWSAISAIATKDSASNFSMTNSKCPSSSQDLRENSFIVNTKNGKYTALNVSNFKSARTFSQVVYDTSGIITSVEGMWVEAVRSELSLNTNQAGYIDFHIRACWDSTGQSTPATIGTIVRLYEPR